MRAGEGLGLGLTVAKHIFDDQNASIRLVSDGKTGTSVYIRFNAPKAGAEPERKKIAAKA